MQSCKRSLEQVQAENFTLNKELVTLKLTMQAVELADGTTATAPGLTSSADGTAMLSPGPRASVFFAGGLPGAKAARGSMVLGAASDAGLGFSGPGVRGSVAALGLTGSGGAGMGILAQGAAGGVRASVVQYGAGRLSVLPAGLATSAQLSRPASSPYAVGPRKSVTAPPGS